MKKKSIVLALALLLAAALCGCGGRDLGVIGGADGPTTIIVSGPGAAKEPEEPAPEQPEAEESFAFVYKGVSIAPDAAAAPLLAELGEPLSYFEAPSCAFEGLDKIYGFPGFELDTYPDGEADYVSAVVLRDDSVATPEGLMIGSPAQAVEAALGEADIREENLLAYDRGGSRLRFILEGEEIVSIEYLSLAAQQQ